MNSYLYVRISSIVLEKLRDLVFSLPEDDCNSKRLNTIINKIETIFKFIYYGKNCLNYSKNLMATFIDCDESFSLVLNFIA